MSKKFFSKNKINLCGFTFDSGSHVKVSIQQGLFLYRVEFIEDFTELSGEEGVLFRVKKPNTNYCFENFESQKDLFSVLRVKSIKAQMDWIRQRIRDKSIFIQEESESMILKLRDFQGKREMTISLDKIQLDHPRYLLERVEKQDLTLSIHSKKLNFIEGWISNQEELKKKELESQISQLNRGFFIS